MLVFIEKSSPFNILHPKFFLTKHCYLLWFSPFTFSSFYLGYRSNDIQHLCTPVMVERTRAWLCSKSAASISSWHDGWLHICFCHRLLHRLPVPGSHSQCCPNTTLGMYHIYVIVWLVCPLLSPLSNIFSMQVLWYLNSWRIS